jgi:hypothetical protein
MACATSHNARARLPRFPHRDADGARGLLPPRRSSRPPRRGRVDVRARREGGRARVVVVAATRDRDDDDERFE